MIPALHSNAHTLAGSSPDPRFEDLPTLAAYLRRASRSHTVLSLRGLPRHARNARASFWTLDRPTFRCDPDREDTKLPSGEGTGPRFPASHSHHSALPVSEPRPRNHHNQVPHTTHFHPLVRTHHPHAHHKARCTPSTSLDSNGSAVVNKILAPLPSIPWSCAPHKPDFGCVSLPSDTRCTLPAEIVPLL